MIVVDAHQDIAYNTLAWGRDYRRHPYTHRQQEMSAPYATLGLPDAILGRVAVVFASLFTAPATNRPTRVPYQSPTYRTPQEAYQAAMRQCDVYQELADESGQIRLLRTQSDLTAVLDSWSSDIPFNQRIQGLALSFEGADPILEPRQFEAWYERGVRIVGLAWTATRYSGGTGAPAGLSHLGYELLAVMAGYNAIVDLAHASEKAFFETLDAYSGVVIASHANPRRFCDTDRHLSDTMIQRLAERGGVMGVVMLNSFLSRAWTPGARHTTVSLENVADVIDYVCQLTGSSAHVGIGSDLDGGFGAEATPLEIDTESDLLKIADILEARGYSETDISAVMSDNFLRQLRAALP